MCFWYLCVASGCHEESGNWIWVAYRCDGFCPLSTDEYINRHLWLFISVDGFFPHHRYWCVCLLKHNPCKTLCKNCQQRTDLFNRPTTCCLCSGDKGDCCKWKRPIPWQILWSGGSPEPFYRELNKGLREDIDLILNTKVTYDTSSITRTDGCLPSMSVKSCSYSFSAVTDIQEPL